MTLEKIKKIVEDLRNLDLSKKPEKEIISLFAKAAEFPVVHSIIYPGRIIVRGQNYDSSANYSIPARHSFKPQNTNDTYQRASLPSQTMFYGAVTAFEEGDNVPLARHIIITEIAEIVKDKVDKETIVFSSWEVIEELNLISIIQSEDYKTPSKIVLDLQETYKMISQNQPGVEFMNFISSEFSKEDVSKEEDFKYIISALYAKMMCDFGFDGVAYPSVRAGGAGMNVAIKPDAVNKKMRLVCAYEVDFERKGMEVTQVASREIILLNGE